MVPSTHVVRRIASFLDQTSIVACCLSSRVVRNALMHPDVWQHATVYRLDTHAAETLYSMKTKVVKIEVDAAESGALERFLSGLAPHTQSLHIALGTAALSQTHAITSCICELSRLQHLVIECARVCRPSCLAFPAACMPDLRTIRIFEKSAVRKLEVYFSEVELPALQEVMLEVCTSDILANLQFYRQVHSLVYVGSTETFEDARLEGVRLESLYVHVPTRLGLAYLQSELVRALCIGHVTLVCHEDAFVDTRVNARHLTINLRGEACAVEIEHAAVRRLHELTIHAHSPYALPGPWVVQFVGVGSWHNFHEWLGRCTLVVGCGGKVVVNP